MTQRLILVRHAEPDVDQTVPAAQWGLSARGRWSCLEVADRLLSFGVAEVVTSQEAKAVETGALIAERLGLSSRIEDGLHEHERTAAGYLRRDLFEASVRELMARPDELVLGSETGRACTDRFDAAIGRVLGAAGDRTVVVVTHGTVMSLWLERRGAGDAFEIWRRLSTPSVAVLSLPGLSVERID